MNPLVKFDPSIPRSHFALAAVVAAMLATRPHSQLDWSGQVVLMAGMGDFLVIAVLALAYGLGARVLSRNTVLTRAHDALHWILVLGAIAFSGLAQALFLHTGEALNVDMLAFFLRHAGDLSGVASSVMDTRMLWILVMCLGIPLLANLRFSSRFWANMHLLVLAIPIGLIPAGPLIFPDFAENGKVELSGAVRATAKPLYRGVYQDIVAYQRHWDMTAPDNWRRGILIGVTFGSAMGLGEYQALTRNESGKIVYLRPHAPALSKQPANVLFILLESMRHDALGVYGGMDGRQGPSSDTPFLDGLASDGWRVANAYTTIPHTSKALVGIYCGTFPRFETSISEAALGNLPLTCLPHLMRQAGYATAHFQTAPATFEDRDGLLRNVGVDYRFTQESIPEKHWARLGYLGLDDQAMVLPAVHWMKQQVNAGKPFFASMLTIATHHPYASPGNIAPIHDAAAARKAYVQAVRYTDALVKRLFIEMRKKDLLSNTLVVITGDHGEAFAEHGQIAHNGSSYEEGMRVPLILHGPMLGAPRVISGLRQHIDIMPTVLDIAGIAYAGMLPGKSVRADSIGHNELMAACFYQDYCLNHWSQDGKKLLFFYGKRKMQLFDLMTDPAEQRNLLAEGREDEAMRRLRLAARMKKSYEMVYSTQE